MPAQAPRGGPFPAARVTLVRSASPPWKGESTPPALPEASIEPAVGAHIDAETFPIDTSFLTGKISREQKERERRLESPHWGFH